MLALNFVHLIIEHASRYPRVPLIRKSFFARNDPFSHLRSHIPDLLNKCSLGSKVAQLLMFKSNFDFLQVITPLTNLPFILIGLFSLAAAVATGEFTVILSLIMKGLLC